MLGRLPLGRLLAPIWAPVQLGHSMAPVWAASTRRHSEVHTVWHSGNTPGPQTWKEKAASWLVPHPQASHAASCTWDLQELFVPLWPGGKRGEKPSPKAALEISAELRGTSPDAGVSGTKVSWMKCPDRNIPSSAIPTSFPKWIYCSPKTQSSIALEYIGMLHIFTLVHFHGGSRFCLKDMACTFEKRKKKILGYSFKEDEWSFGFNIQAGEPASSCSTQTLGPPTTSVLKLLVIQWLRQTDLRNSGWYRRCCAHISQSREPTQFRGPGVPRGIASKPGHYKEVFLFLLFFLINNCNGFFWDVFEV